MITVGFAICGSFCTFKEVFGIIKELSETGIRVIPIMSENAYNLDTRFGSAESWRNKLSEITGEEIIHTIQGAEPIGPKSLLDALIIAPCTGNTLAKLSTGVTDTPVTLAAKAHLRNNRPVLIAISTNDALSGAAKNIGALENYKNIYFVPYRQDNFETKSNSIVADFTKIPEALSAGLNGIQLQPMVLAPL